LQTRPAVEVSVPTLALAGEWKDVYKRERKPILEATLLSYIRQRRWFGGKARHTRSIEIQDVITVPYNTSVAHLVLVRIEYSEGEPETYHLPITFALEEQAGRVVDEFPQAIIARLRLKGKDGEMDWVIYDALVEPGFRDALLKAMARRRYFRGEKGELVTSHIRTVFRKIHGPVQEALESALLTGEQTNTSVVYGDRFKLKLFRRLEEGVSPELEIGRFLTEKESFPYAPLVAGVLEYRHRRRGELVTLGILHEYIPNEGDGWGYTLDSLRRYFERVLAHPGVEAPLPRGSSFVDISEEALPPIAQEIIGPYLVSAQLLGQRTAQLHLTLASAVDDPNLVPELFSVTYQRSLCHGMRGFASQVLKLLRQRLKQLPDEVKADARCALPW